MKTADPSRHPARPSTALLPLRSISAAQLSSSAATPASYGTEVAAVSGDHGGALTKKSRMEVPLPSQEGTKGAVQYAL